MPGQLRPRAIGLGAGPRVTDYRTPTGEMVQGVNAKAQQNANTQSADILSYSPQGLAEREATATAFGLAANRALGRGLRYSSVRPNIRMGPIPKQSIGSGMTAKRPGTALGYTPGGYTPPRQIRGMGFEYMPPLSVDTIVAPHSTGIGSDNPTGLPPKGVGYETGDLLKPTYQGHDWSWWVYRFQSQGRAPGAWQQTGFPTTYRPLTRQQVPNRYNVYNSIALARPISQQAYMLPWVTPASAAAQIGGGAARPLGYGS